MYVILIDKIGGFTGFRKLPMDQQIMIVQMAMYPVVLTKLSTEYDLPNRKYNYFNFEDVSLISTNCIR